MRSSLSAVRGLGLASEDTLRSIQVLVGDLPPLGSLVARTEDMAHLNEAGILHNVETDAGSIYEVGSGDVAFLGFLSAGTNARE